ncbi:MAG TPA: PD-(D/E)XK nuclease family protein [Candidatus Nanoarchaeia archaeon]|nr:PD-(D/E)XK nuclease family protein [Candidatus Nanoarchaeia archaeon]
MAKRLESPSSINTFKQCRRKYYYQYIEKLPTVPNVHQVRGNITHSVLEFFFDIDISEFSLENYALKCREIIQKLFLSTWKNYQSKLNELNLNQDIKQFYFEETMLMLMNWVNHFINDLKDIAAKKGISVQEAFKELTPIREQEINSKEHYVRGFIDAIKQVNEEIHIIDYKTNSTFEFKESFKLQLAIYSLLYLELHGRKPDKVGIFFLRSKLKMMNVDEDLLELARKEIAFIHGHTQEKEQMEHYPKTVSGLCKWKSGQCDFYGVCKPHEAR